uniref:Uncharacterized protein n=1 Tax=Timema tahoe TaxID=61484 RepID=A0A7R9IMW5_9NEOP|nr:unnamed protein product [Timema tahoe]
MSTKFRQPVNISFTRALRLFCWRQEGTYHVLVIIYTLLSEPIRWPHGLTRYSRSRRHRRIRTEPVMPMIPLGLKETKEIDFREPFKRKARVRGLFTAQGPWAVAESIVQLAPDFTI